LPEAPVLLDVPLEELPLFEGRFWLMLFVLVLVSLVVDPLTVPELVPVAPVCSELEVLQPAINAAAANIGNSFFI
jgi:hypothetical protein